MRVTVVGDGSWGTTLAILINGNGHSVKLWSAFSEHADDMVREGENKRFLPGVALPAGVVPTADLTQAVVEFSPEIVVLATPTQFMASVLQKVAALPLGNNPPLFVNVAKGIELESCRRPSEIIFQHLGELPFCALSGPSHAEEVVEKIPTAVVAASRDPAAFQQVRTAMMNEYFRVYTSGDVVGVELGGALKNVYAIAAGVCDGLGLGDNSKAALLTRAISEMARVGRALGGEAETFAGLSGVGDLIVTCCSRHSRNRRVGEEIGRGKTLAEVVDGMGKVVAEGVKTTLSARQLAASRQIDTPIVEEVYQVLYCLKDIRQAVHDLMTREPKAESL